MELKLDGFVIRSYHPSDVPSLTRNADNPNVVRTLRDRFPHPYTEEDAVGWIALMRSREPETGFAIVEGDEVIGGIGLELQEDVHARSAELGYWLAEPWWGRGICTAAVRAIVPYAFRVFPLIRIFAAVFETNPASARILEKAGFTREGILRQSVVKNGRILDQQLYAILRDEVDLG